MASRAGAARPELPSEALDITRALSFVNTLSARGTPQEHDKLTSYAALVAWACENELLRSADANRLTARARKRQDEADRVMARARDLRELLHETFTATAAGKVPSAAILDKLSGQLADWHRNARLVPTRSVSPDESSRNGPPAKRSHPKGPSGTVPPEGSRPARRVIPGGSSSAGPLQWVCGGGDDLSRVVWEVSRAVTRLLTSSSLSRVRPCATAECGWWFLDDTKNASRRWCDMKICGNREKLRRYRERNRD